MTRLRRSAPLVLLIAGCRASAPASHAAAESPVRVAPPDAPVSCAEWVRRAVAQPELDVERVPEPVAYVPAPLPKRLPKGVIGKDGRAEVRVKVVVDTLGHADMRTFAVVRASHPKLAESVRLAIAKWTFRPAEVGGCKVPRIFNWGAVAGGRS